MNIISVCFYISLNSIPNLEFQILIFISLKPWLKRDLPETFETYISPDLLTKSNNTLNIRFFICIANQKVLFMDQLSLVTNIFIHHLFFLFYLFFFLCKMTLSLNQQFMQIHKDANKIPMF